MLENPIPARGLRFTVKNCKDPGEMIIATQELIEELEVSGCLIHDISFVQSENEILLTCLYRN